MVQLTENDDKVPQPISHVGGRRAALRDVAALAGTNGSAASVVLNGTKSNTGVSEKTRQRIVAAALELGYQPNLHAQSLVKGSCTNMVALLPTFLDAGVHTRQLLLLQNLLAEQGYNVPVYARGSSNRRENLIGLLESVCQQQPRAIITSLYGSDIAEQLGRYRNNGGIVVRYDANSVREAESFGDTTDFDTVTFDADDGIYQAARHLLDLGHRKLGFFNGGERKWERAWMSGFGRALAEHDLKVRDDWRFCGGDPWTALEEGGAILAQQWLALPSHDRPTGLCILNDQAAVTFIAAVERAGLQVPRDVSVVGFDDLPIGRLNRLQLTTISKPLDQIAHNVAELLQGRVEGRFDPAPRYRYIRGELQVRESTASPS